jgi:ubiquitin C-terminal hydrolase
MNRDLFFAFWRFSQSYLNDRKKFITPESFYKTVSEELDLPDLCDKDLEQMDAVEGGLQKFLDYSNVSNVRISSVVKCEGTEEWIPLTQSTEKIVTLYLTKTKRSTCILELLNQYQQTEQMDGKTDRLARCDRNCNKLYTNYDKKTRLTFTGTAIVIAFNRTMYVKNRLSKSLQLVTIHNQNGLMELDGKQLVAAIVHSGGHNRGHYTTYVKSKGTWYYIDDKKVKKQAKEFWLTQKFQKNVVVLSYDTNQENYFEETVKGIHNFGNSCFFASNMQLLLHSPSFMNDIFRSEADTEEMTEIDEIFEESSDTEPDGEPK